MRLYILSRSELKTILLPPRWWQSMLVTVTSDKKCLWLFLMLTITVINFFLPKTIYQFYKCRQHLKSVSRKLSSTQVSPKWLNANALLNVITDTAISGSDCPRQKKTISCIQEMNLNFEIFSMVWFYGVRFLSNLARVRGSTESISIKIQCYVNSGLFWNFSKFEFFLKYYFLTLNAVDILDTSEKVQWKFVNDDK